MTAYNTLSDVDLELVAYGKQKRIKFEGTLLLPSKFDRMCGLHEGYVSKVINSSNDPLTKVKALAIKCSLGMSMRTKLHFFGDIFVTLSEITECAGCTESTARARVNTWKRTGNCDKLFRPVKPHYYGRATKPLTTKEKKPKRKDVRSLRPVGTWERENL